MREYGHWFGILLVLLGCNLSYAPFTPTPNLPPITVVLLTPTSLAQAATAPFTATPTLTPTATNTAAPTLAATPTTSPTPTTIITATAAPTFTPPPLSEPEPSLTISGQVAAGRGGLRLRQFPDTEKGAILFALPELTRLEIKGRTRDNAWLLVRIPEGFDGWVSARYIVGFDMNAVPVIENPQPVAFVVPTAPPNAPSVAGNITGGTRAIYVSGQAKGNRRNVFTTIGDSLTDTEFFLRPIGGGYNLQSYGYLLPTLQYYLTIGDLPGNSFTHGSQAARAGWSTLHLLDAGMGCGGGNIPLVCELRATRPAVALILIGTNDLPNSTAADYGKRLQRIVEIVIEEGTVPVLSTLPTRSGYEQRVRDYNQQVSALARRLNVPLWDLNRALAALPNQGLGPDGIHLSIPPGGAPATLDFTAENLQYGTTMWNLTALQMLHTLLQQGLY